MLKNVMAKGVLMCAALLMSATLANAQDARQTVNFTLGYFTPLRSTRAMTTTCCLRTARSCCSISTTSTARRWAVSGCFRWARHVEGGIGVSYSSRTAPSVYGDFVDPDGTEIDQDLRCASCRSRSPCG